MIKLNPLAEYCDTCDAEPGEVCAGQLLGKTAQYCDERWRRAAETRECLEEEARERRADGERTYQPHGRF